MDRFPSDPFSGVPDDADAPRAKSRDSLLLTAQIRVLGHGTASGVRVRNLSSGGLMAELRDDLEGVIPGSSVEVDVRGIGWVAGRVAWVTDGRAGIAFDRDIDPKLARKPVNTSGAKAAWPPR